MSDGVDLEPFERAVERLRLMPDPLRRIDAIRTRRERLTALEAAAVRDARAAGVTWKAIGALSGLTKQGAQQRSGAPADHDR